MTADYKPLTDDEIKEMLAEHYERKHPTGSWCQCDLQNWPCNAHRALEDLRAVRKALKRTGGGCAHEFEFFDYNGQPASEQHCHHRRCKVCHLSEALDD